MMNIGTRFEALRCHTALVVTISEEKQIHEANLKLIMARVNAATSLLKWARGEGNPALHDTVEKLYDIALMWSTVQKQLAEQCLAFSKSLSEILQVEQGLDAIKKQHKCAKEELEKLQKQAEPLKRKSDLAKINELEEEIFKKSSEEEELAAELQVKFVKGEIFKAKVIKGALLDLMDTYKDNAVKVNSICDASKTVIDCLPDVPRHLTTETHYQKNQSASEAVAKLAKNLGLEQNLPSMQSRSLSDVMPAVASPPALSSPPALASSQAFASPPPSPTQRRKEPKQQNDKKKKKRNSNFPIAKLIKQRGKVKRSVSDDNNHIQLPSSSPPHFPRPSQPPPALPSEFRGRSQSSNLEREESRRKIKKPLTRAPLVLSKAASKDSVNGDDDDDDNDDDNYEEPGYIRPNLFLRRHSGLVRCASDSTLSSSTKDDYNEPLDRYESLWDDLDQADIDHLYDTPYDCATNAPDAAKSVPPPKPKRRTLQTALYVNTDDVEKLLQEFYEDSNVKDQVKPEVKQRVFKKIALERKTSQANGETETEKSADVFSDAEKSLEVASDVRGVKVQMKPEVKPRVFKKPSEDRSVSDVDGGTGDFDAKRSPLNTGNCQDDAEFREVSAPILRKPEKRIRSKGSARDSILLESDVADGVVQEIPDTAYENRRSFGSKLRKDKPPKLPVKSPDRTEPPEEIDSKPLNVGSPPKSELVSPTGNNVKDLASMLKAKVPMSKNGKPVVPPRPAPLN